MMKRAAGRKGSPHKAKEGSARNDSCADSINEQPQVSEKVVNPDHYPPDDLPSVGEDVLEVFVENPRPTPHQLDALRANIERQDRKIKWSIGRPDQNARIDSAISRPLRLKSLCKLGVLAKHGTTGNINQSLRAQNPRVKVSEDGTTISDIIGRIFSGGQEESAKELWTRFFEELDDLTLEPKEVGHPTDPKKSAYQYDDAKGKRRQITFGTFAKMVSAFRTGEELP